MKVKSGKFEFYNNNKYLKKAINKNDQSYNYLINNNVLLLNKNILQLSPITNNLTNNNSFQKNNKILINTNIIDIGKNEWSKNRLKITKNYKERKIIYKLESEKDKNKTKNNLVAYKEKGFYLIYKSTNDIKEINAKIKWNILSNHFTIYDKNNNIIEEITYNFNFKRMNGPTKLQIILPFINSNYINGMGLKRNDSNNNYNSKLFFHKMVNKIPEYNSIFKYYVLNFINRKIIPNEKNIQIIYSNLEDKDNILLQFAQVGNDEYILDYKYPFDNNTAFSLAISILSSRIFYQ